MCDFPGEVHYRHASILVSRIRAVRRAFDGDHRGRGYWTAATRLGWAVNAAPDRLCSAMLDWHTTWENADQRCARSVGRRFCAAGWEIRFTRSKCRVCGGNSADDC